MTVTVYYNEFDKKKCAALKQLMKDGHITEGDIDDRPIQEVKAIDIQLYTTCHFFAGIGLWDYALDLARWPETQRVWTGSCPCQPFSTAGRQRGKKDNRHLWPEWFRLISECKPPVVFGEQVAAAISKGWLDDVYQGLETQNYAVGSAVLPACSVGKPHRRDRAWFVAYRSGTRFQNGLRQQLVQHEKPRKSTRRSNGTLGNAKHNGSPSSKVNRSGSKAIYDDAKRPNLSREFERTGQSEQLSGGIIFGAERGRRTDGSEPWENGSWIECPDGKQRLTEPRIRLLDDGYPERVGLIHCAGDAIVPEVAAEFIKCFLEASEFLPATPPTKR